MEATSPRPQLPTRPRRPRRWPHWLGGFVLGWLIGFSTLLILATLAVHLAPFGALGAGDSDIRLQIHIGYLNDVVQRRLAKTPQVVVGSIKTTGLQLALEPQAGMVLTPTFDVAGVFQVSPSADNQLAVRNGKLAMTMLGNPRLGSLPIPLDMLPFDLVGQVHQAVDRITNDVLLAELNDDLKAGFGSDAFSVTEVQTAGDYLTIKLQRK